MRDFGDFQWHRIVEWFWGNLPLERISTNGRGYVVDVGEK